MNIIDYLKHILIRSYLPGPNRKSTQTHVKPHTNRFHMHWVERRGRGRACVRDGAWFYVDLFGFGTWTGQKDDMKLIFKMVLRALWARPGPIWAPEICLLSGRL